MFGRMTLQTARGFSAGMFVFLCAMSFATACMVSGSDGFPREVTERPDEVPRAFLIVMSVLAAFGAWMLSMNEERLTPTGGETWTLLLSSIVGVVLMSVRIRYCFALIEGSPERACTIALLGLVLAAAIAWSIYWLATKLLQRLQRKFETVEKKLAAMQTTLEATIKEAPIDPDAAKCPIIVALNESLAAVKKAVGELKRAIGRNERARAASAQEKAEAAVERAVQYLRAEKPAACAKALSEWIAKWSQELAGN
jgi:hypothetical protein